MIRIYWGLYFTSQVACFVLSGVDSTCFRFLWKFIIGSHVSEARLLASSVNSISLFSTDFVQCVRQRWLQVHARRFWLAIPA